MNMTGQPPGWYPLPDLPDVEREWNGDCWIGEARPVRSELGATPKPPSKPPTPIMGWLIAGAIVAALAWIGASLIGGGGGGDSGGVSTCEAVSDTLRASLERGLVLDAGVHVESMAAVRSGDRANVWFVAGQIVGPGVDSAAVWATNDLNGGGMIFAVDGMAQEFSDWGDGGSTDARLSMSDDGAEQAKGCL